MEEKATVAADTLELLMLNQAAIRAALEELSLWVNQRGSTHVHDNIMTALAALDVQNEGIRRGIELMRS